MSEGGYDGLGGISTTTSEFNANELLVEAAIARISTMKIVKVVKVDAGSGGVAGTVDVQPLVSQVDGKLKTTPHGVIFGIPFFRLGGGKNMIVIDPKVGDMGIMVVADRDISGVKSSKKESPPGSFRKHDAADGIYLGSILAEAPEQYVKFSDDGMDLVDKNGNKIETRASGVKITGGAGGVFEMLAAGGKYTGNFEVTGAMKVGGLATLLNSVQLSGTITAVGGSTYAGNIITLGQVRSGSVTLDAHTHSGVQSGSSNTGGPT